MKEQNEDFEKILRIIEDREFDDVQFERLKDTFISECGKCGQKTAKYTALFGLICHQCDSHLVQKKEI